jgi:hypothetical protein
VDHRLYNEAVRQELTDWAKREGVDLRTMSREQARAFVMHVQSSDAPSTIRGYVAKVNRATAAFNALPKARQLMIRGLAGLGIVTYAEQLNSVKRACDLDPKFDAC